VIVQLGEDAPFRQGENDERAEPPNLRIVAVAVSKSDGASQIYGASISRAAVVADVDGDLRLAAGTACRRAHDYVLDRAGAPNVVRLGVRRRSDEDKDRCHQTGSHHRVVRRTTDLCNGWHNSDNLGRLPPSADAGLAARVRYLPALAISFLFKRVPVMLSF